MSLHCKDFVTSFERVVIKLKIVKYYTWNSEYLKLGSIFTIIQLYIEIYVYINILAIKILSTPTA